MVLVARHDEQGVGQAVEVGQDRRADRLIPRQCRRQALGAAADGSGDVELRGPCRAARQQEVGERPDDLVELVDQGLESLDVAVLDGRDRMARLARGGRGQVGAEVEQLVLDPRQLGGEALAQADGQGDADLRVEFVHRSVRLDPP